MRAEPDFNVDIKKGSQVLSVECFFPEEDEEGEYNDDGYTGMIYYFLLVVQTILTYRVAKKPGS